MPRDAGGTYTLPLADVISGTLITSTWANTTMDDLGAGMTDSLSRSGNGAMTAPLKHTDGAENAPSSTFNGDPLTGHYLAGVGDMRATVSGVDRMRWLAANAFPQIWDNDNSVWNDIGAGGVSWTSVLSMPATAIIGKGYVTQGAQSTLMPANPPAGHSIAFADLNDDWSDTNFLTLDGNGNTFTQDGTSTYELNLKGAFAQFSLLGGQWEIVNFGRLSDAYGYDLQNYYTMTETDNLLEVKTNPNYIINGGFDFWQRATTFVNPTSASEYNSTDRWRFRRGANETGLTIARSTFNLAGEFSCHLYRTSGDLNDGVIYAMTTLETADSVILKNQFVTLSFEIYVDVSFTAPQIEISINSGTGQDEQGTISAQGAFPTGNVIILADSTSIDVDNHATFQTVSVTAKVPADSSGFNIHFQWLPTAAQATDAFDGVYIGGVKVEIGEVATPFTRAGDTIAGELAACQRYYEKSYRPDVFAGEAEADGSVIFAGGIATTGRFQTGVTFRTTKRTAPTFVVYSSTGTINEAFGYTAAGGTGTPMAAIYGTSGENSSQVSFNETDGQAGYRFNWIAEAEL